jgi:DNA-binding response OmpR family regulator
MTTNLESTVVKTDNEAEDFFRFPEFHALMQQPGTHRTESSETPEPSVARDDSALSRLLFEPGAFVYRDHRQQLSGKPLQVRQALAKARGQVLTLVALWDQCWGDAEVGEETVRSAVKAARAALRHAIQAVGVTCPRGFDPIPSADRGTGRTAWRLQLP